jgi:DNA-directed RNA polymerase specialized sigma24 family protein
MSRDGTGAVQRVSVRSVQANPQPKRIADRLTETQIGDLINSFEQGTAAYVLAKQHGMSTEKNLLKKRKVRAKRAVADRLPSTEIDELVAAFLGGTPKRELATRYGISESSMKRLLRAHGAQRRARG